MNQKETISYGFYDAINGISESLYYSLAPLKNESFSLEVRRRTILDFLDSIESKSEKCCASITSFLTGYCSHLAIRLNEIFGYSLEVLIQNDEIIHMYCTYEENGEKYYIDCRGITNSFEMFSFLFSNNGITTKKLSNKEETSAALKELLYEKDSISDIMCDWFLANYKDYIDINIFLETVEH